MQAWPRLQQCLSPSAMISPVWCVAKSSNLDADVNLELSEDSRHRGLKGTPLSPQVFFLAVCLSSLVVSLRAAWCHSIHVCKHA